MGDGGIWDELPQGEFSPLTDTLGPKLAHEAGHHRREQDSHRRIPPRTLHHEEAGRATGSATGGDGDAGLHYFDVCVRGTQTKGKRKQGEVWWWWRALILSNSERSERPSRDTSDISLHGTWSSSHISCARWHYPQRSSCFSVGIYIYAINYIRRWYISASGF